MKDRVILYNGADNEQELAIKCSIKECVNWGGFGICDLCGMVDSVIYLCPELGSKGLCSKCFNEHKTRVKWYPEDTKFILAALDNFIEYYKLEFTPHDMDLIEAFKEVKSTMAVWGDSDESN